MGGWMVTDKVDKVAAVPCCGTMDSAHNLPVAPNLLDREFDVDALDQVWVGDISYL
jgi:hypothetical protein